MNAQSMEIIAEFLHGSLGHTCKVTDPYMYYSMGYPHTSNLDIDIVINEHIVYVVRMSQVGVEIWPTNQQYVPDKKMIALGDFADPGYDPSSDLEKIVAEIRETTMRC